MTPDVRDAIDHILHYPIADDLRRTVESTLEQLASHGHEPPSRDALINHFYGKAQEELWAALVRVLDSITDPSTLDGTLAHCEQDMGVIEDCVRTAPRHWLRPMLGARAEAEIPEVKDLGTDEHGLSGTLKVYRGRPEAGAPLPGQAEPRLVLVRHIDLAHCVIEDAGVALLARCPFLSGLISLNLELNLVTEVGARELAASPYLGSLQWLNLRSNRLGPAGVENLVRSTNLCSLRELLLEDNQIGDSGVDRLLTANRLPPEVVFGLAHNGITYEGGIRLDAAGVRFDRRADAYDTVDDTPLDMEN